MAPRQALNGLAMQYAGAGLGCVDIRSAGGVDVERRVAAGEPFDLVWLASDALDRLEESGHVLAGSRVDLMRSDIWVGVRAGSVHPDIDTEDALREAVRGAKSLGYSTGPSGRHLSDLFERWGLMDEVAPRIVRAPAGIPVGVLIANGQVELGFQQHSELVGMDGVDAIGPLPRGARKTTMFSGAVCARSDSPDRAGSLLAFMASPAGDKAKRDCGMEPA